MRLATSTSISNSPSGNWFRLSKNGCVCRRGFKSELAHHGEQVGLLKRLRKRCSEQRTRFAHVGAAVSTNSDDRRARIFIIGAFDVPGGAFAVNCRRGVRRPNQSTEREVVTHRLAYEGPLKCSQTLHIPS